MFLNLGLGRMGCLAGALASASNPLVLDLNFLTGAALDARITFTRASSATGYNSAGTLTSYASDVPRKDDYDPAALTVRGFAIEEQRTNLVLQSADLSNAAWTKTSATIGAGATAPDGTTASSHYTASASPSSVVQSSLTVVASTAYVFSCFLKAGTATWLRVQYMDSTFTNGASCWVNISTGTLGTAANLGTGTNAQHSIESVGGGWYRYQITGIAGSATAAVVGFRTVSADSSSTTALTSVDIFGCQLEQATKASSYIPTTASSATRAADSAIISGANFSGFYNAVAGTLLVEGMVLRANAQAAQYFAVVSDGTTNNRTLSFLNLISTTTLAERHSVAGVATNPSDTLATIAALTVIKLGMSVTAGTLLTSVNGATGNGSSPAAMPTVSQLTLGANEAGTGQFLNGWLRKVRYRNVADNQTDLNALNV